MEKEKNNVQEEQRFLLKENALLLPLAETELARLSWADELWEEPVVEWLIIVPLALLVVKVGGYTSEVAQVQLETSLHVLGEEVWIRVVLWVRVALHGEEDSDHERSETNVKQNDAGVELPSISWLLVSVVSVLEVAVVEGVDLFGAEGTPVAHGLLSNSVQLWILVGKFWSLWEWDQVALVVIWVSVGMFQKFLVLRDGHHVAWEVHVVLLHRRSGHTSHGERAADSHP